MPQVYFENKKKIKSKELVEILQKFEKLNPEIYISNDEEGNNIHPILSIQAYGDVIILYPNQSIESLL